MSSGTPAATQVARNAAVLLDPDVAPIELRSAVVELTRLCGELLNRQGPASTLTGDPIVDVWRDAVFARGLMAALGQPRETDGPAQLLVVGLGAYPISLLPLLGHYTADALQITLLDQHPKRLRRAHQVFERLGAGAYIAECVVADATVWQPTQSFDVAVVEAIDSALRGADTVGITRNLSPHVCGPWLPERVDVSGVLVDYDDDRSVPFGDVVSLTREGLVCASVQVPGVEHWGDEVRLITHVCVYGSNEIQSGQSGITQSRRFPKGPTILPSAVLTFALGMSAGEWVYSVSATS